MEHIAKIDIHAHVRPKRQEEASMLCAEDLLPLYDRLGVEKAVILPFLSPSLKKQDRTPENSAKIVEQYPDRFLWFTSLDLTKPTVNEKSYYDYLSEQKKLGAKGVGEVTSKVWMDSPAVEELFYCCEALELPVLFHISPDFDQKYGVVDDIGLARLDAMLTRFPRLCFIGHAKPFWNEISRLENQADRTRTIHEPVEEGRLATLLRRHANLYCDLSAKSGSHAMMRDPHYAAAFLEEFQDRVLYGTDLCSTTSVYPFQFADFLEEMRTSGAITEGTYRKLCRENVIRLLHLQL
ncbi:MAG: amidohydrolase family protein [Clostridia bacterium]|nr:amidohydrolase family protein [Clostridia bacterium]